MLGGGKAVSSATLVANLIAMSDFRDLLVYQKAHALELRIHVVVDEVRGPKYASLRGQMRRAGESIAATIVESRGQQSRKEEIRFLNMSVNSASELEHHLLNAKDLGAINDAKWEELTNGTIQVRRMLYGLIRYLKRD